MKIQVNVEMLPVVKKWKVHMHLKLYIFISVPNNSNFCSIFFCQAHQSETDCAPGSSVVTTDGATSVTPESTHTTTTFSGETPTIG